MTELKALLERADRAVSEVPLPTDGLDGLRRRRDRKHRNQRITAGVVGLAVFVAAVWIVTGGVAFDWSTPAVLGRSETGPTQTEQPTAPASAAPDVVRQEPCTDGATTRLELTSLADFGGRIKVRFEVHGSPVGRVWRIELRHHENTSLPTYDVVFRGTRTAGDGGDLAVLRRVRKSLGGDRFRAIAVDWQTRQRCEVQATLLPA